MPESMGLFDDPKSKQPTPSGPGYLHNAGVAATNLLPGLLSNILPSADARPNEPYIPGVASGLYSTADTVSSLLQRYAGGATPEQVYHLPGSERAGQLAAGSQDLADKLIPHMDPQSEGEKQIQGLSNTFGSMMTPFPEAAAGKLPIALERVARFMAPGPKAATVGTGIAAGLEELVQPANASPSPAQPSAPSKSMGLFDEPAASSEDDNPLLHPASVGLNGKPMGTTTPNASGVLAGDAGIPQKAAASLGLFDQSPQQQQAPGLGLFDDPVTKAEQDQTGWTFNRGALVGGGAIAVALLAPRYLRSIRDVGTIKFGDLNEKWHADVAANGGIPPVGSEAPLPGAAGSYATGVRQNVLDRNAVLAETMKATASTPIIGEQARAFIGDINGAQPMVQRFQAGYEKGELLGTKIPGMMQNDQAIAKLSDSQRSVLNTGMHYGNELDNRYNNWLGSGRTSADIDQRVRFPELNDVQLRSGLSAAQADPAVKAIMDAYKLQSNAKVDMLVANDMLTAGEGQKLKNAHATAYVPDANMEGIVEDPLLKRNITPYSGSSTLPNVWDLLAQHDFNLFEATEANRVRAYVVNNLRDYQTRDLRPGLKPATIIQDSKNPVTGEWVSKGDGSSLPFRNGGVLEHFTVNNSRLFNAMKGPAVQVSTALNAINKVRQFQQSFITGVGAIASGHVFPLINAVRSVGEIAAIRPAGMYGTHFDKWAQKASGGRLALRGDPISGYAGMLGQILQGTAAESSRAISTILDGNNSTVIGSRLRSLFGNKVMDAVHDRAKAVYDGSTRAAMRDAGVLNSAGFSSSDVASNAQFRSQGGKAFMPQRDMVPELYRMNDTLGAAAPTYVHLRNLFDEMRSIVGEAAHANFFELNRDNPRINTHQLNYETRQITGDPGTRGAGKTVRGYAAAVPFGNVSMQEVGRVMRAMHEEPIGTTLGYITHYGTLAAASAFTAMLAGPDAVRHLFDSTSDPQRSNAARLYVPGHPENPVELPIQIMMRPAYNLMAQLFHDLYGMSTHHNDPNMAMNALHTMTDLFSHHIWQSTAHGALAGVSGAIPPVMPTAASGIIAGLTGRTVQPDLYEGVMHSDKPISEQFSYDITGANQRVPGQIGKVDPVTGSASGVVGQHILSDIMGIGGVAMYNFAREISNAYAHGEGINHALENILTDYKMRLRDDIPGGNLLWGGEQKLTRATPLQQNVERATDNMRPTTSWRSDIINQGYTRKFGPALIEPVDPNVPKDPVMQKMYATTGQYMNILETKPNSPLKMASDLRKQIDALGRSDLSPTTVRSLKNEYEREIQNQYANQYAIIHQLESKLSAMVGGAPVDMRYINWKKGPEQFTAPVQ